MALLVGYESSDEEEQHDEHVVNTVQETQTSQNSLHNPGPQPAIGTAEEASVSVSSVTVPPADDAAASVGPRLPPADTEDALSYPEEPDQDQDSSVRTDDQPAPSSPYTASRSLIHTLTLPAVPNLDIPPSPPGSPSAPLTAKFDKFLELKRTKGTHFNARIADSHALKNPPLMDKLLDFAGVSTSFEDGTNGVEQYSTTLPTELWNPASFPEWAYRGPLRKTQERMLKENVRAKGEAVQFVPAI